MPKFYLMCGIPASGKSTIAKMIASDENAVILSSDEIREELYSGQEYNSNQNGATFKELNSRLDKELKTGQNYRLGHDEYRAIQKDLLSSQSESERISNDMYILP